MNSERAEHTSPDGKTVQIECRELLEWAPEGFSPCKT